MNWRSHYRLGDTYWHCLFLRKIGGAHTFYCREEYHKELRDVLEGCDVTLKPIQDHTEAPDAIDAWIGSDQKPGRSWYAKGCPNDVVKFLMEWFAELAAEVCMVSPFNERSDLLADYPALELPARVSHVLIINANPQSSQCPGYIPDEMSRLAIRISKIYNTTVTNNINDGSPFFSLSQIGAMSRTAKLIISVATSPIFATFNIWNKDVPRYILLDPLKLDYGIPAKIEHHGHVDGLTQALERDGWI
jgi:hypothetical protein